MSEDPSPETADDAAPTEPIDILFAECLERVEREGPECLDRICAQHPDDADELRARFSRLGRIGFLQTEPPTPERIGSYRIVEEVGRGGMGTVYRAEQLEPVRRTVAIKVVRPGMDSGAIVARFEAERQTLALLDHPMIAKVYDAGSSDDGRPYFAMEFVAGRSITRYCDENQLTTEARLRLFASVCKAVHHAHMRGVIHRDLKPSNILVGESDGQPLPKIIDFGIAKATELQLLPESVITQPGQILGTLEYMSPEQAGSEGVDVDTRTDVYALGVVLYELLCGELPVDPARLRKAGLSELCAILYETEAASPSTRLASSADARASAAARRTTTEGLARRLRGELDWIVLKAIAKERERRYESVLQLAEDVEHHLVGLPVTAAPVTWRYRARKFVRRHRVSVFAGTTVVLALAIGLATALAFYLEARRNEQRASRAEQKESVAHEQTRRFYATAKDAIDSILVRFAKTDLVDMPHLVEARREVLEDALGFYKKLLAHRADDVDLREEIARAHARAASIHRLLGRFAKAREHAKTAVRLADELHASAPDDRKIADTLSLALFELGENERQWGDQADAIAALRRSLEVRDRAFDRGPSLSGQDAHAWNSLGLMLIERAPKESARAFERAIELVKADATISESDRGASIASVQANLGSVLVRSGKAREAEKLQLAAARAMRKLVAEFPDRGGYLRMSAHVTTALAHTMRDRGRVGAATNTYQVAIDVWHRLLQRFPDVLPYRLALADLKEQRANLLASSGKPWQAPMQEAIEEFRKTVRDYPDDTRPKLDLARSLGNMAMSLRRKDAKVAIVAAREALSILEKLRPKLPDEPRVLQHEAACANTLGRALIAVGEMQEAGEVFDRGRRAAEQLVRRYPDEIMYRYALAMNLHQVAYRRLDAGDAPAAIELWQKAEPELQRALDRLPKNGTFRGAMHGLLLGLALGRSTNGEPKKVVEVVARLVAFARREPPVRAQIVRRVIDGLAVGHDVVSLAGCATRLASDAKDDPELRHESTRAFAWAATYAEGEQQEECARRALAGLEAAGAGFVPSPAVDRDPAFEWLRRQPGFSK